MILDFINKRTASSSITDELSGNIFDALQERVLDDLSARHQHLQKMADALVDKLEEKEVADSLLQQADEVAANVLTTFGHLCKNDRKKPLKHCVAQTLSLLEETYPGVGKQITVDIDNTDATFTESLLVVFLYNLMRASVEALTPHAILRISLHETQGKLKGLVKVDGLKSGLSLKYKIEGQRSETESASLNPRKMDSQSLIDMMTDAGHQTKIRHFTDSSTSLEVHFSNFIDVHQQADNVTFLVS